MEMLISSAEQPWLQAEVPLERGSKMHWNSQGGKGAAGNEGTLSREAFPRWNLVPSAQGICSTGRDAQLHT